MATARRHSFVAVVEDDASMRKAIESLLRSAGFKAVSFASAETFLASKEGRKARFLVLDLRLPGMSGLELHARLRKEGVEAPTVLVTGDRDINGELRAKALSAGVLAVLYKPFDADEFLRLVQDEFAKQSS
jgi:FixJ family two-component response regulator